MNICFDSDEQKTTSERIATLISENKSLKKELNGSKKEVNTLKKDLEVKPFM